MSISMKGAKASVLKRWPKAIAWKMPFGKRWIISRNGFKSRNIGIGWSAKAAWADAAKTL